MKIKESGWTGRAKVAFVLSATVILSLIFIEGNSEIKQSNNLKRLQAPIENRPSIILRMGDISISLRDGLSYSEISKPENKGKWNVLIDYLSSDKLADFDGKILITLGRNGKILKQSKWLKLVSKKTIDIQEVVDLALAGDMLEIETVGVPKGMPRFIALPIND